MKALTLKALAGFGNLFVLMSLAIFLPAGSMDFPEAWVFLAVFLVPSLLITIYFLKKDPGLIERRLAVGPVAEKKIRQKVIQSLASVFFLLLLLVPGFDHRLRWSRIPPVLVFVADGFILIGFFIVSLTFRVNSYTSAVIEIAESQRLVSEGPYAVVRHPMYSGALLLMLCTPIALGSWWGVICVLPLFVVVAFRLLDEENVLLAGLPGYREYSGQVRYRLIPHIW
jgi:protein-S-isoprenylcysteine O-methyltransferase Ste14